MVGLFGDTLNETTFLMIKPDGVHRNLVGDIISRLETKGLKLVGMRAEVPSIQRVKEHYSVHEGKPFYDKLVEYITSGPVVAMAWQGIEAIDVARKVIGATNPRVAEPGTIRGDLGMDIGRNLIHGSDGLDTASSELAIWFPDGVMDWEPVTTPWVVE